MDWGIKLKAEPHRDSGLFGLLVRNYLCFTLTLLLIAAGIYLLWDHQLNRLLDPFDWDGILTDDRLAAGDYDALARRLKGSDNAFSVLDGNGAVLYQSDPEVCVTLTPAELACVSPYDGSYYIEAFPERDADGNTRYRVLRYTLADGMTDIDAELLLDAQFRVLSGSLVPGQTAYTARQYAILSGAYPDHATLYRYDFTADDSSGRILLLQVALPDEQALYQASQDSWRVWLLAIPLYVAAAGFFIHRISRRIRKPLDRLHRAVVAQAQGKPVRVGDCGGVRELARIGESFDRLFDRLAESEREREQLDRERQQMIANISHDLKTPVTVISGYVDALADGKVPPEQQARYLAAIRSRTAALTQLINAFHEYSKVEHPRFVLQRRQVDLCEYLREYLAAKYDEIELAGFTLQVDIPETPCPCSLDPFELGRALDNLIGNSLRYNRLGTVLSVSLALDGTQAVVTVADNGHGIPADRLDTIFEPFVVGSDARNQGGSGLGLSITRRIVELHGGSIGVESGPSTGTAFTIRLPMAGPGEEPSHKS